MFNPLTWLIRFASSCLACLLPEPPREAWAAREMLPLERANLWVASWQISIGLVWWGGGFLAFAGGAVDQQTSVWTRVEPNVLIPLLIQSGPLTFIAYWFSLVGAASGYLWLSGLLRVVLQVTTREIYGDAVLSAIYYSVVALNRRTAERLEQHRAGPVRPDRIVATDDPHVIHLLCSRRHPEWTEWITLQVGERFFSVQGPESVTEGDRLTFAYKLKERGEHDLLRGVIRHEG